jgi:hypothetical protein
MRAPAVVSFLLFTACSSFPGIEPDDLTQSQVNAIETRVVEASMDETFTAASHALFDAGYQIAMSDRTGGLLTGTKIVKAGAFQIPAVLRYALSIQIRKTRSRNCEARIHTTVNGEARVDKEAIDQIWVLMQRQVLMKGPPPRS